MRYRISDIETVSDGIKRIVLGQVDRALEALELKTRNKDRAVHDVRVCFKKIRAALRLIQAELGDEAFRFENIEYRDAGRQLAAARDTVVIADTLEDLLGLFDNELGDPDIKSLRKRLRRSRIQVRIEKKVLREVVRSIQSARERVDTWVIRSDGFSALRPGLQKVYEKGCLSLDLIRTGDATTENVHEWRKQVKYLMYQVSILNPLWPRPLDVFGRELNKLADYLSKDHDLALLRSSALEQADALRRLSEIEKLVLLIDQSREQLQAKAVGLGVRLYAEDPNLFADRFQAYWEAWRPAPVGETVEPNQLTFAVYEATSNK